MLKGLFSGVKPGRYNLLNRVLTLFQDTSWRGRVASKILEARPGQVLDLCCGTGDLAFALARRRENPGIIIVGLDFCRSFLQFARCEAEGRGVALHWVEGDAAGLPFPDESLDCIGMTFSFRNLLHRNPRKDLHLREMFRVMRRQGRVVIAETAQPSFGPVRWLFHLYLRVIVSWIGGLISGNRPAYRYLAESAVHFMDRRAVEHTFLEAGFADVQVQDVLFGAVCIYTVTK